MFNFTKNLPFFSMGLCIVFNSLLFAVEPETLDIANVTTLHKFFPKKLTGKGINFIVIDYEFDVEHEAIREKLTANCINIVTNQNLDSADKGDHGTHISAILAGKNGGSQYGIAPEATMQLISLSDPNDIYSVNHNIKIANALQLAAKSTGDIVSISMELRRHKCAPITDEVREGLIAVARSGKSIYLAPGNTSEPLGSTYYTQSLIDISEAPEMMGAMILVGNSMYTSHDSPQEQLFPGSEPDKLGSDRAGKSQKFITAPGTNVYSALKNNTYGKKTGTSFSTPVAAGVAGLLKEAFPHLTPGELNHLLLRSARKKTIDGKTLGPEFGHGIVDAFAAGQLGMQTILQQLDAEHAIRQIKEDEAIAHQLFNDNNDTAEHDRHQIEKDAEYARELLKQEKEAAKRARQIKEDGALARKLAQLSV